MCKTLSANVQCCQSPDSLWLCPKAICQQLLWFSKVLFATSKMLLQVTNHLCCIYTSTRRADTLCGPC